MRYCLKGNPSFFIAVLFISVFLLTTGAFSPACAADAELTSYEQLMLNMVNQDRSAAGLNPLVCDLGFSGLAKIKACDMISNNYFSHSSPVYGSPLDMMRNAGIQYSFAGENLAGASTVQEAYNNLMNSPGHRANILNNSYIYIGIAVVDGGNYGKIFVMMFTG